MSERVFVVGVGMTKFSKPAADGPNYLELGQEAVAAAMADSGLDNTAIQQAYAAYIYGETCCGQRILYRSGFYEIPIFNVNNACASGSTALYQLKRSIEAGLLDCGLAVGFEQMQKGSIDVAWADRPTPLSRHFGKLKSLRGIGKAPGAPQIFGNAGRYYMEKYGTTAETFARVAAKNHRNSVGNPNAQFRDEYSVADILASPMVWDPLTRLQCSPTSNGAAAAVLASERFVREHGLQDRAVEMLASQLVTDPASTFEGNDADVAGAGMTRAAARAAYVESGKGPEDLDVIELHDCFSTNELITYDGLGLCDEGGGGKLIDSGATDHGGDVVVNPSGGLISKGHPIGATGLAQCHELTTQLRNEAGPRQVPGATVALQHNLGLGGACVINIYGRPQ